jgi:hypothetical protein
LPGQLEKFNMTFGFKEWLGKIAARFWLTSGELWHLF